MTSIPTMLIWSKSLRNRAQSWSYKSASTYGRRILSWWLTLSFSTSMSSYLSSRAFLISSKPIRFVLTLHLNRCSSNTLTFMKGIHDSTSDIISEMSCSRQLKSIPIAPVSSLKLYPSLPDIILANSENSFLISLCIDIA